MLREEEEAAANKNLLSRCFVSKEELYTTQLSKGYRGGGVLKSLRLNVSSISGNNLYELPNYRKHILVAIVNLEI